MPIEISFHSNGFLLKGKIHPAEGDEALATIILLHGSPGNEIDVLGLGQKLSKSNYTVLTFNYSGTYQSEGLFSFENTQHDIHAAYQFLHQSATIKRFKINTSRLYPGGWSYGGGMALAYAAKHPEISRVFSIAGTDHGEFMREYVRDAEYRGMVNEIFNQFKQADSPLRLAPGATPAEALEENQDMSPYDLRMCAPQLASKHILLIGGWDDPNVKVEHHLLPLYRALKAENAEHVTIEAFQDNHAFTAMREQLAESLIKWMHSVQ